MTKYKHSTFPLNTEDNYLLSQKGFGNTTAIFKGRNGNSQISLIDGTSDTSSSVKEKKMIRIIKFVLYSLILLTVSFVSYNVVNHKLTVLKEARAQVSPVTAELRQRQLDCLARNIYHEAGYEPFEGKVAVAQVTINRAESGQFPSDICQVVYQKNIVYEKVLCQFSWYCDSASLKKPMNGPVYVESMEVAKKVLLEGFRIDSVKKALYYHADYINPKWNREKIAKLGHHVFYK